MRVAQQAVLPFTRNKKKIKKINEGDARLVRQYLISRGHAASTAAASAAATAVVMNFSFLVVGVQSLL